LNLLFYISGHGFGHAARAAEVINALHRLAPGTQVTLRTSVPQWFLSASIAAAVDVVAGDVDTGMVQPDSLSIDEEETARQAARFYSTFPMRVAEEVTHIGRLRPTLVAGDIPPLAFAAAARAGVPSVAISNFTWDWIYSPYPRFTHLAPGVMPLLAHAQSHATLSLRLPFSGGFATMRPVTDIPLVARVARVPREETRARLRLASDRPLVLATFGGHGGAVPLALASSPDYLLVATDYEARDGRYDSRDVRIVTSRELQEHRLSYTDLLAACDVAVTKLGYGIVSECVANQVALLYTTRGTFIEQDVFIKEMPAYLRCRFISRDDVRSGRWSVGVQAVLTQPPPTRVMRRDGAEVAAGQLIEMANGLR
jgi:L-arabinokinase